MADKGETGVVCQKAFRSALVLKEKKYGFDFASLVAFGCKGKIPHN